MRHSYLCVLSLLIGCNSPSPATSDAGSASGSGTGVEPGTSGTGSGAPTTTAAMEPGATGSGTDAMSGTGTTTTGTTSGTTSGTTGEGMTTTGETTTTGEGMTTTGETTTTGDSTTSGGPVEAGCPGGEPLFQLPELTVDEGLEWCPDGQVHRHTAVECVHPLVGEACDDPQKCAKPCDAVGEGVCNTKYVDYCGCQYPCVTDADCPADAACLCEGARPVEGGGVYGYVGSSECVPANCRTDADCAPFLCALSPGICGYGTNLGLFCHTPEDECLSEIDCFAKKLGDMCIFAADEQRWKCTLMAMCE